MCILTDVEGQLTIRFLKEYFLDEKFLLEERSSCVEVFNYGIPFVRIW